MQFIKKTFFAVKRNQVKIKPFSSFISRHKFQVCGEPWRCLHESGKLFGRYQSIALNPFPCRSNFSSIWDSLSYFKTLLWLFNSSTHVSNQWEFNLLRINYNIDHHTHNAIYQDSKGKQLRLKYIVYIYISKLDWV